MTPWSPRVLRACSASHAKRRSLPQIRHSTSGGDGEVGQGKLSRYLVDYRRLRAVAGSGGEGGLSFTKHRKHVMIGPGWPCGGHGGKGGSVFIEARERVSSLSSLTPKVIATNGRSGMRDKLNGPAGQNKVVLVPRGVVVRAVERVMPEDGNAPIEWKRGEILADLNEHAQTVEVAKGGNGGRGNNMANPYEASQGYPGEERWVELVLKTIADVGLVGMPNAGKSTLISCLSRAAPKIAPYPFTTLAPYVGRADFADGSGLTIADVPGLVEGAHMGEGLGHEFLRHLERTKILLYVIDFARSENPFDDFLALQREVALFSLEMATKPSGIIANKCDVWPHKTLPKVDHTHALLESARESLGEQAPLFLRAISARFGEGIVGLLQELRQLVQGKHAGWEQRLAERELGIHEDE